MAGTGPRLVSAGAGSGKTHRIVEEVVSRVRAGTPLDRIAAVTFTDAAASELQERVRARLLAEGLPREAARVEGAAICTIHRFALTLLTRYPLAAGISPAPLVLDKDGTDALLDRVLAEDLRAVSSGERRRWLEDCFGAGVGLSSTLYDERDNPTGRLRRVVHQLLEKCRSLAMDPDAVLREGEVAAARMRAVMGEAGPAEPLEAALARGHALAMRWLDENPSPPYKTDQPMHDLLCALRAEPAPSAVDHAVRVARAKCGAKTAHALAPLIAAASAVTERHPEVHRRVEGAVRGAFECASRVLRRFQEEKTRLGAIDFEDMQVRAYALLTGALPGCPAYAPLVADALPFVIVDEFQDTSPLQYRLFEVIRAAGAEVTFVGDLKQGIYGFRTADSTLFAALLDRAGGSGAAETLDRSRRSRPELVRFANALFGAVLPTAGMRFDPLEAENAYTRGALPKDAPCVDVVWHARPHQTGVRVRAGLARVRALLGAGAQVLDRATGAPRALRPGDIAVLAYNHEQLARWNEALRGAGIPTALDGGRLFDALEVQLARAWLAMIASPRDRAAAAAVLVSELYGVSQRTMVRLTLRRVSGSPRRALELADENPAGLPLTAFERRALARCAEDLAFSRAALRQRPLAEAVEAVFERVELAARLSLRCPAPDAAQVRANLSALVGYAHALAARGDAALSLTDASGATLENYLIALAAAEEAEPRMPSAGEASGDAVRLVTLHGSKGMEYPVEVLDVLSSKVEVRLPRVEVLRPRRVEELLGEDALARSGVQLVPEVDLPAWRDRLTRCFDAESRSRAEWLRLLYVAVTRAREHLVVLWPEAASGTTTYVRALLGDAVPTPPTGTAEGVDARWLDTAVRAFASAADEGDDAAPEGIVDLEPWRALTEDPSEPAPRVEAPSAAPRLARVSPSELCQVADCPEVLRIARFSRGERHALARAEGVAVLTRAIPDIARLRAAVPRTVPPPRVGKLVHAAVERARMMESDPAVAALADGILADEVLRANGQTEHALALGELVVGTLADLRAALSILGCASEPSSEVPFAIDLAGSTLHGIVDLVVPARDGLHVVDLKTHLLRREDLPRWAAYYAPQLDAYALAVARLTGQPVVGRHLVIPAAGALVTLPGAFEPAEAERSLGALVERIARGVSGPARDCAACGWRQVCRVGWSALTTDASERTSQRE